MNLEDLNVKKILCIYVRLCIYYNHNYSIGVIPKNIGEKLEGREFKDFDEFRNAFWTKVGNSKYADEFSDSNIELMKQGLAPYVISSQANGGQVKYVLHHNNPIHNGEVFMMWII